MVAGVDFGDAQFATDVRDGVARRLGLLLTFPRFLPAAGPVAMRSATLMDIAVRVMGNLVTDEDADWVARVWRGSGRVSRLLDRRKPFS